MAIDNNSRRHRFAPISFLRHSPLAITTRRPPPATISQPVSRWRWRYWYCVINKTHATDFIANICSTINTLLSVEPFKVICSYYEQVLFSKGCNITHVSFTRAFNSICSFFHLCTAALRQNRNWFVINLQPVQSRLWLNAESERRPYVLNGVTIYQLIILPVWHTTYVKLMTSFGAPFVLYGFRALVDTIFERHLLTVIRRIVVTSQRCQWRNVATCYAQYGQFR